MCRYLFFFKKNMLVFDYMLNNLSVSRKNVIKDLGILFDSKLSFNHHIGYIRNKVFMKLGFLKRMRKDFDDESTLKTLYFSLVRSRFDYAALIWHTNNITQNQSLPSVQNHFLRYLSYKCHL